MVPAAPAEARRGHQILWVQLQVTGSCQNRVLETKLQSSARAVQAFKSCAISAGP